MLLTEDKIEAIKSLCKANRVKHLYAFGSVTREDFDKDSDIDLIVDFDEIDPYLYTDLYFNLKFELEELLQRKIDLLEDRAIQNQTFRQELDGSKVLIYEQKNQSLA
jgi:predicted nucleotidyltransferase